MTSGHHKEQKITLLAGDIDGTKTALALFAPEGGLVALKQHPFRSGEFPSLAAVTAGFLDAAGVRVDRAVFGVAGPVAGGRALATNLPWATSEGGLREALGTDDVKLLNDLEATAHGVPHLPPDDLYALNDKPVRSAIKAVLAPGTGLGEAVLYQQDGHYHVIPSEGGHADLAPKSPLELELLRYLMAKYGHVSYERVCSGRGIPRIYAFLRQSQGAVEPPEMNKALTKLRTRPRSLSSKRWRASANCVAPR